MQTINLTKPKRFTYLKVIQQNYGQGWEDVSQYDVFSTGQPKNIADRQLIIHDVKEYRLMGYPTRVIFRKEKNNSVN